MKRFFAVFLAVCLAIVLPAAAAPTRVLTEQAQQYSDLIHQVQPLVDATAAAAIKQQVFLFREGTLPEPALVEGLLYQSLYNHLLVYEAQEGVVTLSPREASSAVRQLFFPQDLPDITAPSYPGVTLEGGLLRFDLARQDDFIGAHIYDIAVSEEELIIKADIYRLNGIVATAEEAPEENLVWLGHIGLRLRPLAGAALGFGLASFSVPERYTPSRLVQFVQKDRFEVQYPDFLVRDLHLENTWLSLASEDGSVTLTVRDVPGTLEGLKQEWLASGQGDGGSRVAFIENNRLKMASPGVLRLAYFDPLDGADNCLVLEWVFPAEKEHEFSLYEVFLDNSFVVYSHSVG